MELPGREWGPASVPGGRGRSDVTSAPVPLPADVVALLRGVRTVVVVGASDDRAKAAHRIPARLVDLGYDVVPVNPRGGTVLGRTAHRTLGEAAAALTARGTTIDLVDVFRPARETPTVVAEAVAVGAPAVWLQSGITSAAARALADAAGVRYVEDRCLGVDARVLAEADRAGGTP